MQPLLKSGEIQIPPAQVVFLLAKALAVVAWGPPSDQALQRALTPRAHEYKTVVESFSVEQYMELKENKYTEMEDEFRGQLVKLYRQWMNTHDFRSKECNELLIRWRDDPHNSDLTDELVKEWGFELPSSKWGLSLPVPPPQADDYFGGMREDFVRMQLGFLSILAVNPERAIFGVERNLNSVRSLISLNQDKDWPKDRFKADQRAIGGKASQSRPPSRFCALYRMNVCTARGRRSARSGSSGARFGQWYFTNILHANVGSWVTHSEVGASSADVAPR